MAEFYSVKKQWFTTDPTPEENQDVSSNYPTIKPIQMKFGVTLLDNYRREKLFLCQQLPVADISSKILDAARPRSDFHAVFNKFLPNNSLLGNPGSATGVYSNLY